MAAEAPQGDDEALQTALAAEHAAIYGYGVVGAHLSGERRERAREAWNAHRAARDRLRTLVRERGSTPSPAAPDYRLPHPVTDTVSAVHVATGLEERVGAAYAEVVAAGETEGTRGHGLRHLAATTMRECAVRATRWRGATVPFPGLRRSG